tara:strand:- start:93 stop:665 length:573 start_codon:yes stop_codon:yes gene_type:complete
MKFDNFDFVSSFDTVTAVILGAVLATLGGFVATQLERWTIRRERRVNAAEIFDELLSSVSLIVEFTRETHGRGDPYGPFTIRLLHSIDRELAVYDRNRERLFDISKAELRFRIQNAMTKLSISLDGMYELTSEINAKSADKPSGKPDSEKDDSDLDALRTDRDIAFSTVLEIGEELKLIADELKTHIKKL